MNNKSAFSLIELSIVLIVIGFLVSGVIAGKKLIDSAKLSSARSATKSSVVPQIDNLILWLDAASEDSFINGEGIDNVDVSQWLDLNPQSDVKKNVVQYASCNLPNYDKTALNGLPALDFSGSNTCLRYEGKLGISGSEAFTHFLIIKTPSGNNQERIFQYGPASSNTEQFSRAFSIDNDDNDTGFRFSNGNREYAKTSASTSYLLTLYGATGAQYNQHQFRLDGELQSQINSTNENAVPNIVDEELLIGIGRTDDGSSVAVNFTGSIGEVIFYDRQLSTSEIEAVESYLNNKWGI